MLEERSSRNITSVSRHCERTQAPLPVVTGVTEGAGICAVQSRLRRPLHRKLGMQSCRVAARFTLQAVRYQDAASLAIAGVASGARAASPAASDIRARGERVAVAVVGKALVDVYAPGLAVTGVTSGAWAASPAASDIRARGERVAVTVAGEAFVVCLRTPVSPVTGVTFGAWAASPAASGIRARGERVAVTVVGETFVDVYAPGLTVAGSNQRGMRPHVQLLA